MDSGRYGGYDFSTASNLLETSKQLLEKYGDLDQLHSRAKSPRELEAMLTELKGVGPTCVNIFLRELRGIWGKANPRPSKLAFQVMRRLRVNRIREVESQLVRINLEYCKKSACDACPVRRICVRKG